MVYSSITQQVAHLSLQDYTFQHHVTSGSRFGFQCQPGTFLYHLDKTTSIVAPKFKLESRVLVHVYSPPHVATVIGIPIKFQDVTIAECSANSELLESVPDLGPCQITSLLLDWIKGGLYSYVIS